MLRSGERKDLEGMLDETPEDGGPSMPEAARAAKVEGSRGEEKTVFQPLASLLLGEFAREERASWDAEDCSRALERW